MKQSEKWLFKDREALTSIDKGMKESKSGQVVKRGSFAQWCPQHGYPEPCVKCNGMTAEEREEFFRSLAEAVSNEE